MRLYARDFSVPLTSTEKLAFEEEIAFEKRKEPKCNVDAPRFAHPDSDVRNFLWHAQSMFPNNYLNPVSIKQADLESLSAAYASALDSVSKERDIQSYIRDGEKWYIPGALDCLNMIWRKLFMYSYSYISKIENGIRKPSLVFMTAFSGLTGTSLEYLIVGKKEVKDAKKLPEAVPPS